MPNHLRISRAAVVAATALLFAAAAPLVAADDVSQREEQAIKAAVERVAPSVVRIETFGGLERIGSLLIGTGPTTGLIVSADGYIASSAFNFVQKPSQILVHLPDGTRLPATLVATDHSRMIVLLKVKLPAGKELPVPVAAPQDAIAVGQWSLAVGRTYESAKPSVSVGIISAINRIWGKAMQTDAKISPNNYGGPLVDIEGRVMGVLVPLSPMASDELAGVEWYDSGIGFAVPLEGINKMLPRLEKGEDLYGGLLGISMKGMNIYDDEAELAAVQPNSPAYQAGLKPEGQDRRSRRPQDRPAGRIEASARPALCRRQGQAGCPAGERAAGKNGRSGGQADPLCESVSRRIAAAAVGWRAGRDAAVCLSR